MPVVSIMLVNVLQMWPKIALSHFMDETEGNNDANASTTLSLSIEFACARGLDVTVARCFSAPRAAEHKRLAVNHAYDGVVVVHQVAAGQITQPVADLCRLSGSAFGDEGIAVTVLSYQRCVYEQRLTRAARKGKYKHQGVVQAEVAHVVAPGQGAPAVFEVFVGYQQAAV